VITDGARHLRLALLDPEVGDRAAALIQRGSKGDIQGQMEQDIAEASKDTPEHVIVFKSVAYPMAARLRAMRIAIESALPTSPTPEGREAARLAALPNAKEELDCFYTDIALAAFLADGDVPELLGSFDWKTFAIGMAPAALGIVGAVLPGTIGNVINTVGGSISSGLSSILASKQAGDLIKSQQAAAPPPVQTQTMTSSLVPQESSLTKALPWLIGGGVVLFVVMQMRR